MTKSKSAIRNPQSAIVWLIFLTLIVAVYFLGLNMPLVGPDEPRYAQVAREMFERGDWITPTLGAFNWFEKPALLYWLQIASYNLLGVSEFAARLGSALSGLGTVAALWLLGRNVERLHNVAGFAGMLALIAASTVGIIAFAHGASFDIILTFPVTGALASFYIYYSSHRDKSVSAPLVFFYVFVGLALLAKGLIGVIIPAAVIGAYFVMLLKKPPTAFALSWLWGGLITLAVASVWYLPMYMLHGNEFIDQFFIQHHFQRYTSNKYLHPQPFYFFLWVMPLMTIPWTPFFLAGLWDLGKRLISASYAEESRADASTPRTPLSLSFFGLGWLAVPVLFFSFSGSKLPGYILPAVPGAIIVTTVYLYRFAQKAGLRKYVVPALAAGTFIVVIAATLFVAPGFADADSTRHLFSNADARGLGDQPVLVLHGISHNAEFYAHGRILREPDGKQKKFPGPREVQEEIARRGGTGLVMVPHEYLMQLLKTESLESEVLDQNDDWAIVFVRAKRAL